MKRVFSKTPGRPIEEHTKIEKNTFRVTDTPLSESEVNTLVSNGEAVFFSDPIPEGDHSLKNHLDANYYFQYAQKREEEYPKVGDQLDQIYHELETTGSLTISGSWFNTVKTVKDATPKPD